MASQLIERLMSGGIDGGVHAFAAALGEYERGVIDGATAASMFGLTGEDATEAEALTQRITPITETITFGGYLPLTNVGSTYDAIAQSRGLGVALIQIGGLTSLTFGVRVNKVGTGTQSWQLWNETAGQQVIVLDDTGASGDNKTLSDTVTFDPPLGNGQVVVRVRCKSTVAADDPVYYGGTLLLRRTGVLSSFNVHEILMLAEQARPGYTTPALVRARLGL